MKKHMLLTVVAAFGLLSVLLPVRQAANPRHHVPPLASPEIPGVLDKRIAVLPFLDLSDNQQMAWFAEDMREEILLKLAKVDGFNRSPWQRSIPSRRQRAACRQPYKSACAIDQCRER